MTCDICSAPSVGPRCPTCRRDHGDAPTNTNLLRVEPPTRAQRVDDHNHGWTDSNHDTNQRTQDMNHDPDAYGTDYERVYCGHGLPTGPCEQCDDPAYQRFLQGEGAIQATLVTQCGPGGGWPVVRLVGDRDSVTSFVEGLGYDPESFDLDVDPGSDDTVSVEVDWADEDYPDTMDSVHHAIGQWAKTV